MQAVILAGGLGTRLRPSVPDLPKAMAEIDGRPFLQYLLEQVRRAGFREAVLCVGYRQDAIREYFRGGEGHNIRLIYSAESEPLGTGGALKLAEPLLTGDRWLVMNGDSFLDVPLEALVRAHDGTGAIVTLAVVRVAEASRFGAVELGPEGEVTAFTEKGGATGPALINGGIYVVERELLASIPPGREVSLEREVFPGLIGRGLYGFEFEGEFTDIGTPEDYRLATASPGRFASAPD